MSEKKEKDKVAYTNSAYLSGVAFIPIGLEVGTPTISFSPLIYSSEGSKKVQSFIFYFNWQITISQGIEILEGI